MNILTEAHKELLLKLLLAEVDFMLIGGYAVNYHGYPRYTSDMDIWLMPDNENKLRFVRFLKSQGFEQQSITAIESIDFTVMHAFHIGSQENRIDFLTKISGIEFNEAYAQSAKLPLGNQYIPVIQFHHLILSKIQSNRPKDKADVDELQRINRYKNNS